MNHISLYTFDQILCNIHYFRIFQLHCDGRMHYNFAFFRNFKGAMSVRIFVSFKGCAGAP